ncbi:polysaccharide biosynthesis tyrosine autokinase [Sphaerochaeta halotolerans]|uniref:non-specific protein-tyrosine kinase n=1 Tax=Sphaerochaeta halotolerans TaxID=2293840 RepID=A0A372MIZ7_9SPIR|nr:polysaccharide biosynthesis tyrosine autokinase [Sphaerochaeta halotolerans]RFU95286.1 polysaccharide biosynthesis tyrosine autokinase [Sphaerochaeta halotolerans]
MSQQEEYAQSTSPFDAGEEGISIAELLHIFHKRLRWFFVGFILVVALALGYLQIAIPQYESEVSVLVDPIQTSSSFESLMDMSASSTKIATEVELITSRSNIDYALSTLDLSQYKNADGFDYRDKLVLGNLKERIAVTTVKDTNIVRIKITDENPVFARDFANALASSYDTLLTGIAKNSKTAQREFIESQIPINDRALSAAGDALGDFRENSDIIQLTDKSSMLVEQISYYTQRLEPLKLQLREAMVFLDSYNEGLTQAGVTGVLSLDDVRRDPVIAEKLNDLAAWKTELTMYESLGNSSAPQTQVSMPMDASSRTYVISSAMNQLNKDLLDRVSLLTRSYGNESYTQAIVQALTTEVGIQVLEERGEVFISELSQLPVLERRLSELQRDVQIYEAIGLKLREMLEEVKLVEASVSGNVTVVDEAILPRNPVSPNRVLILAVALLLGAAFGLLLTLAIEALDVSIQTEQQIQKIVGKDVPLLGWIPMMKVSNLDLYPTLIVYNDPLSFESERFKLVANMLYNRSEKHVFSITSCSMAEGKSTIIGNIAVALAQMGSKVLIIDGDLRLPSMERYFHLKHREVGLVDYVTKNATLEACILKPIEKVPGLHLLPPGNAPLVHAGIFSNPRYTRLISYLESVYDFVIIDAPPLDSASELLSISKHVDGLIITVRAGITSKGSLFDLISSLRTANVPISGVVFNGVVPGSVGTGYRYGYGYGYGKGYGYSSYASRYSAMGSSGTLKKRRKHQVRKRSNGWYRKMYKRDVKNRGKLSQEQFDAVLAFGPDSPYATIADWVEAERENGKTKPNETRQTEVPSAKQEDPRPSSDPVEQDLASLRDIENDADAAGKKRED